MTNDHKAPDNGHGAEPATGELEEIEREALRFINAARERYRESGEADAPPLDSAPRNAEELHRALGCLGVRLHTCEAVFDSSQMRLAQACADAWRAPVEHDDRTWVEPGGDAQAFIIRSSAVRLPAPLLDLAHLHQLGSYTI